MSIKRTGQLGFADAVVAGNGNSSLQRLDGLVRWCWFDKLLGKLRDSGPGRAAWPPLVLFKALLLGALYGLSERELEEALADRLSFRRFVGLGLEESVPNHSVLNRFRNELVGLGLFDKLLGELDRQLEAAGVVLKRGTMLDATVIQAVSPVAGEGPAGGEGRPQAARRDVINRPPTRKKVKHRGYRSGRVQADLPLSR